MKIKLSELRKMIQTEIKNINEEAWSPEIKKSVKKLDDEFAEFLIKKGVMPYSKEAADLWKSAGYKKRFRTIFGKNESLRGGKQTLMMKGMPKDDDEINEFRMTGQTLNMVKKDLKKFISTEHNKLDNSNPKDTLEMIKQILGQMNVTDIKEGFGGRKKFGSYSGDPRVITVKYPTKCAETGKTLKKGDKAIYYPKDKKMYCMDSKTAQDFRDMQFDIDVMGANY